MIDWNWSFSTSCIPTMSGVPSSRNASPIHSARIRDGANRSSCVYGAVCTSPSTLYVAIRNVIGVRALADGVPVPPDSSTDSVSSSAASTAVSLVIESSPSRLRRRRQPVDGGAVADLAALVVAPALRRAGHGHATQVHPAGVDVPEGLPEPLRHPARGPRADAEVAVVARAPAPGDVVHVDRARPGVADHHLPSGQVAGDLVGDAPGLRGGVAHLAAVVAAPAEQQATPAYAAAVGPRRRHPGPVCVAPDPGREVPVRERVVEIGRA